MAASSLVTILRRPLRVITTLLSNALRRTVARLRVPLRRPLGFPVCPLGKRVDWGGLAYPTWSLILLCYRIFDPITIRLLPYFLRRREGEWFGMKGIGVVFCLAGHGLACQFKSHHANPRYGRPCPGLSASGEEEPSHDNCQNRYFGPYAPLNRSVSGV